MRTLRFGLGSDYARGAAMALTYLRDAGAVRVVRGKLALTAGDAERAIHDLATRVQAIATNGDYHGAVQLIARLAHLPDEIAPLLATLEDLPVDLEFIFDQSGLTFG